MKKPGTTPTPNYLLDNMHRMKPSVFAICMAVVRQTCGYDDGTGTGDRREWDVISTSQFVKLTGLSNRGVIDGVKEAVDKGWIERKGKGNSFRYRLAPYENSSQVIVNYENSSQANYENSSQVDDENYENSSHTKESNNNTTNVVSDEPTDQPTPSLAEQSHALIDKLRVAKNKPAVLMEIYTVCYGARDAPTFSYLGKVAREIGGAGYLAQRLFELTARPPNGNILAYIQAEHRSKQNHRNGNGKESPAAHSNWDDIPTGIPEYMEQ